MSVKSNIWYDVSDGLSKWNNIYIETHVTKPSRYSFEIFQYVWIFQIEIYDYEKKTRLRSKYLIANITMRSNWLTVAFNKLWKTWIDNFFEEALNSFVELKYDSNSVGTGKQCMYNNLKDKNKKIVRTFSSKYCILNVFIVRIVNKIRV